MPNTDGGPNERKSSKTRRQLLATSAGALTVGLAGCSGDSSSEDTPTGTGTPTATETESDKSIADTEPAEPVFDHRASWGFVPSEINANKFNPTGNYPQGEAGNMWENQMFRWNFIKQSYWKGLAESISIDDCTWEVTLPGKDVTWWNGDPITADDAVTQNHLGIYMGGTTPEERSDALEKTGEYSFKKTLGTPINEQQMKLDARRAFVIRAGYWEDYLQDFEDATTDDERTAVREELLDTSISLQEMVDEGLRSGLWIPDEWDESSVVQKKHDGHQNAENTNIEELQIRLINQDQKYYQAVSENNIDLVSGGSVLRHKTNLPDNFETLFKATATKGKAFKMNQRNKHISRIGVRRALAYLLSSNKLSQIAEQGFGRTAPPVTQFTGLMDDGYAEETFGQEWIDQLIDYGADQKTEKATQAMQDAGYSKQGGVWVGPDGDAMEGIRFISLQRGSVPLMADTISSWLEDFGIKNDYYSLDGGSFFRRLNSKHDWDIGIFTMGHPRPGLSNKYLPGNGWGVGVYNWIARVSYPDSGNCEKADPEIEYHYDDVSSVAPDDGEVSPQYGHQMNPRQRLPEEPGVEEIQGDGQEFRPVLWKEQMLQAESQEERVELGKNWARWFNYQAPHVPIITFARDRVIDAENFAAHEDNNLYGLDPRGIVGNGGIYGKSEE